VMLPAHHLAQVHQKYLRAALCPAQTLLPQALQRLADVGYWSPDMITEDIDISWKLQLRHWDIFFEPRGTAPAARKRYPSGAAGASS
jgi:hypothetical protein